MLQKILSIRGFGRLDHRESIALGKNTVIYGDNGRGKTTFCAILRSLGSGNPEVALERRTIGRDAAPTASFLIDSVRSPVHFREGSWSGSANDLEVFDARFVADNVYAGGVVEHEQRRALYRFVVGPEGVALAKRVDELDREVRDTNTQLTAAKVRIATELRHLKAEVTPADFLKLEHDQDIAARIEAQVRVVNAAEQATVVAKKPLLSFPVWPTIDVNLLERLLAYEVDSVAQDAEELTRRHLTDCLKGRGEKWISDGLTFLALGKGTRPPSAPTNVKEICPFCGTEIGVNSLVAAYRTFFSEKYKRLVSQIQRMSASIEAGCGSDGQTALKACINQNVLLAEAWRSFGGPDLSHPDPMRTVRTLRAVGVRLLARLAAKAASPLESVKLDDEDRSALERFARASVRIAEYAEEIGAVNKDLASIKARSSSKKLAAEKVTLARLRAIELRYDPEMSTECLRVLDLMDRRARLSQEKERAKSELESYAKEIFGRYQDEINKALAACNCGYSIAGVATNFAGGRPSAEYCLEILGHEVPLQAAAGENSFFFGNTLSEGDKSALAFAFFLARLKLDPRIADKIVVLDDPITSQDDNRRSWTKQQVRFLAGACRQLIVLTHDRLFAREVYESFDRSLRKAVSLLRAGEASCLVEWDVLAETDLPYFQNYRLLADYLQKGKASDLRPIAQAIRPLLEGNLRARFPEFFGDSIWLGSFLEIVRDCGDNHALWGMKAFYDDLSRVNDYSKSFHHDQNSSAAAQPIVETELAGIVRLTLDLISGLPVTAAP